MKEKLYLKYPLLVEGKYDRQLIKNIISSPVITTDGFGFFKNEEKKKLLKKLSSENGLIILTDSDKAGFFIRNKVKQFCGGNIINLYIPKIEGKEKRKKQPSKEGLLGVEGMESKLLYELFEPYSAETQKADEAYRERPLTKADFYAMGLSGCAEAEKKRDALAEKLGLPDGMSANALLEALNLLPLSDEINKLLERLTKEKS